MTIFWSQQAIDLLQYTYQALTKHAEPSREARIARASEHSWTRFFLLVDCAVEFPFNILCHPLISKELISSLAPFPSLWHLLVQIFIFIAVDAACYRWLPRSNGAVKSPRCESAFDLANDFLVPRITLTVAIAITGGRSHKGNVIGDLHLCTIMSWLCVRRLYS